VSKESRHEDHTLVAGESGPACASYDPALKRSRLAWFAGRPGLTSVKGDLADRAAVAVLFAQHRPERVVHLAAKPDVRDSTEDPYACVDANLVGCNNVRKGCRAVKVEPLVYASFSSV